MWLSLAFTIYALWDIMCCPWMAFQLRILISYWNHCLLSVSCQAYLICSQNPLKPDFYCCCICCCICCCWCLILLSLQRLIMQINGAYMHTVWDRRGSQPVESLYWIQESWCLVTFWLREQVIEYYLGNLGQSCLTQRYMFYLQSRSDPLVTATSGQNIQGTWCHFTFW